MKPKFRIGDRVKTSDGEEFTVGGFYGDGFYNISNEDKSFVGIAGFALELVGCGIPAPALRWNEIGEAKIFMYNFLVFPYKSYQFEDSDPRQIQWVAMLDGYHIGKYGTKEDAREACQAYWQELWDKEMLLSRESEPL